MTSIQLAEAIIGSISVKAKNQGIAFRVTTGELKDEEKIEFMRLQDQVCKILISPIDTEGTNTVEVSSEVDKKPASQRMRGVLYVLFEQDNEGYSSFNNYYLAKMETLIEWLKGKIKV